MRPPLFIAQPRSHSPANQGGFVLVAILMLIALSLVLIVTTSSISQMERKAVSNSTKEEIAKRNALFALEVALAQLQKEAGPDQRVTATADIYNTNATNPNVSQPYWTGVWKTFNTNWLTDSARSPWYRQQPHDIKMSGQSTPILRDWSTNATNVVWLVSGASDNTTINPFSFGANAATGGSNSVVVATGWGTNSNTVSVPLVTINPPGAKVSATSPVPGRYAYWISDEGVKAKVTLAETNLTKKPITSPGMLVSSLVHYMGRSAPYLPSVMTNYGGTTNSVDIRTNSSLPLITSLNGLSYADPSYAGISNNALAADFTAWSYGVLSDVRRGGLKQDLTAAFEQIYSDKTNNFQALLYRSGQQNGNINDNDSLMTYRASTASLPDNFKNTPLFSVTPCIDGVRWQSLYNYYNLYKSEWTQSPTTTSVSGSSPKGIGIPSITGYNTVQSRMATWPDQSTNISYTILTPALVAESLIVQLGATNINSTNFFQVSYYPLVVLYNPYSVALDVNNSSFSITKNLASGITAVLQCTNSSANTNYFNPTNSTNTNLWPFDSSNSPTVFQGGLYPISLGIENTGSSSLLPGEIRVYTLAGKNTNYNDITLSNYPTFTTKYNRPLISSKGLTIGNGYGGVTITLNNWVGSKSPSDAVSLTLANIPTLKYNTYHYIAAAAFNSTNPYTIPTWPFTSNFARAVDLPASLSSTSITNTYKVAVISNTMGQLINQPVTILSVTERLRGTINGTGYTSFINNQTNTNTPTIIPTFLGNSVFLNAYRSGSGFGGAYCPTTETCAIVTNEPLVSIVDSVVSSNASTLSWVFKPVGDDRFPVTDKSTNNNVFMVLRDVPSAPMTSLGQLMHFEEYYYAGQNNNTYIPFPVNVPAMSIGGSFCCAETGPSLNAIFYCGNGPTNTQWHVLMDHSFIANEALFDTYYFSTVPPSAGFTWGTGTPGIGPFSYKLTATNISTNQPLPNPRHVFYRKNGADPTVTDLQDEGKASANLLIDGPFNVNSTSVSAWKALLTSLNGQTFSIYNYISGQFENRYVTNPILRFWSVGRYNPNDAWDGMRSLTDQQVTSLAQEIVNQVRARGPFLSMGDFLNRRLASTNSAAFSTTNFMGALQMAIENTQTNGTRSDVNSNIHISSISASNNNVVFSVANFANNIYPTLTNNLIVALNKIVTNSATGIPGYLMQQDLVQAFAPVMTVRSDTFLVRVYGEADKKTTASVKNPIAEGRAWGEAVVQRVPDFVDQTDPALKQIVVKGLNNSLGDATPIYGSAGRIVTTLNESLGRRFRVVSFRWLNQTDL